MTSGAFRALASLGVSIPKQLSFIGFDDQEWTTMVTPPVSVVAQPPLELGVAAADALMRRIEDPDAPIADAILPGDLLLRASTAAPDDATTAPRGALALQPGRNHKEER